MSCGEVIVLTPGTQWFRVRRIHIKATHGGKGSFFISWICRKGRNIPIVSFGHIQVASWKKHGKAGEKTTNVMGWVES
jgi:hypothetical protein